jgi:hypothetical protein
MAVADYSGKTLLTLHFSALRAREPDLAATFIEKGEERCHIRRMSDQATHPYTLELTRARPGYFYWAVQRNGKIAQQSVHAVAGEENARKRGLEAIERLLEGADEHR